MNLIARDALMEKKVLKDWTLQSSLFILIDFWGLSYKTFYGRDLFRIVISWIVYHCQSLQP
jgi:hypothetical protein